jgi:hypothetical protein
MNPTREIVVACDMRVIFGTVIETVDRRKRMVETYVKRGRNREDLGVTCDMHVIVCTVIETVDRRTSSVVETYVKRSSIVEVFDLKVLDINCRIVIHVGC